MPDDPVRTESDPIINEAKERWEACNTWYSIQQRNWLDDWKFGNADSVNGYQWPNTVRTARIRDQRPVLTINKTQQHCTQIINKIKRNRPEIKVRPIGGGSTYESASAYKGLIRDIMYGSTAKPIVDEVATFQVYSGVGYFRVNTKYEAEDSFNQIVYLERLPDPLAVYIDPDAKEITKSDANFAFVFGDHNRKEFIRENPTLSQFATLDAIAPANSWITHENVRTCEYFRKVSIDDKLYALTDPSGQMKVLKRSFLRDNGAQKLVKELDKAIRDGDPTLKWRDVKTHEIEYYFIVGDHIVADRTTTWPGKYIPIVPAFGQEFVVEGVYDCRGQVRGLIDPQKMYNYWSSTATEFGALQSKTPYIGMAEAIEEFETMWNTANTTNHSVLLYRGYSDTGEKNEPPVRQEPPREAPMALSGMQIAAKEFELVSGQVLPTPGEPGAVERSAAATDEKAETEEDAIYHFRANLGLALEQVGKIILDLIPKIYDTQRALTAMADDGSIYELLLDPTLQKTIQVEKMADTMAVQKIIMNPQRGEHDVEIDSGTSWGTKRQETFHALSLILTQAPQLTSVIGDLLLQCSDFDMAEEAALRLRRMVPPQALGTGPSMQEQAMQAQIANLTKLLSESMQKVGELSIRLRGREEIHEIDVFKAFTERLKVVMDAALKAGEIPSEEQLRTLIDNAVAESMAEQMGGTEKTTTQALEPEQAQLPLMDPLAGKPPMPGMRQGATGGWFMRDLANSRQFRRVS